MKIANATLSLNAQHVAWQHQETNESLQVWVGRRPGTPQQPTPSSGLGSTSQVSLSDAGKASAASDTTRTDESASKDDYKLDLIRSMIEFLTGKRLRVFDMAALDSPPTQNTSPQTAPSAGYGISYDRQSSYSEFEQTQFAASGTVQTADGRTISFSLQLAQTRSYHEEASISIRMGDAAQATDPLVLNFAGTAAQLTDQRFSFDLNADGIAEQIPFVGAGSGFLVFDRNGDGKVNDGRELFGPSTNNGFGELAALDSDHNGWIDENDPVFSQLAVWSRDASGDDRVQMLREAGVGALSLQHIATPFSIKNDANQLVGQVQNAAIFLQENGSAGTMQQIDLTA